MEPIARLNHLRHGSIGEVGTRHFKHGLVQVRIERLADRLNTFNLVRDHGLNKARLNRLHAFEQNAEKFVLTATLLGNSGHRTFKIVCNRKNITRKSGYGEFVRIFKLALSAFADVFRLGHRTQKIVPQLRDLGLQLFNPRIIDGAFFDRLLGKSR